jgi:membrane-bound lytic murein transglycosylase MltF
MKTVARVLTLTSGLGLAACAREQQEAPAAAGAAAASPAPAAAATPQGAASPPPTDEPIPDTPSPYAALPDPVRHTLERPFTGDFDEMAKRRLIRVGVTFNRTHYFIDRGQERGLTYEALKSFEEDLNRDLETGLLTIHVVPVAMSRDQLAKALLDGRVDMVAAMITVRPELEKHAAFSIPTRSFVNEVVVTGPGAPPLKTLDDLAARKVYVRKGSAYYDSITRLNAELASRGKPPVEIDEAPGVLEDDDILEMVNAGLVPITIVDDFLANFWSRVLTNTTVRADLQVNTGGQLAVAFRHQSPRLREVVNDWIKRHGRGDAFRNIIERRYLQDLKFVRNAAADAERRKLQSMVELFRKYGSQYDVDYLLMAAQGYQESTLDHNARSHVGAIGVMQIMPATGKELNVGDIKQLEPNIHAGVKYMRFMMDTYFKDDAMDPLNKGLMAFAAYNAGPGRLRQLRREAAQKGLDPNVWFGNVERIASERIGRETVTYVSNIYKYYLAYRLMLAQRESREQGRQGKKP